MTKANYGVNLIGANNGFIMHIGCRTLVFKTSDTAEAMADLGEYLTGGCTAETKLMEKYFPEDLKCQIQDEACCEERVAPASDHGIRAGGRRI